MAWAGSGSGGDPYCLTCDGTDDTVDLGNLSAFDLAASAFTVEVWVKTTSTTNALGIFDKTKDSVGWYFGLASGANVGKPRLGINATATVSATAINDGNWHHVVATYDGSSNVQVIVDNGTPTTASGVNPGGTTNEPLYLFGALPSTNYLPGSIAQARIYGRVLSGAEITSLYSYGVNGSGGAPVTSGLLLNLEARYANGGTTNYTAGATTATWADTSGNARDGHVVGQVAPGDPTALTVTSDAWARAVGTFTPSASGGWPASCKVFRSQSSGGTYVEVTSNCVITPTGFTDKRPSYGSQPIAHGATGYYKVKATGAGSDSGYSPVGSGVIDVTKLTVEQTQWDNLVAYQELVGESAFEASSLWLSGPYPGPILMGAAYIAAVDSSRRATALSKLSTWWTYLQTKIDAHHIWAGRPTYVYRDDHFRMVMHLMICVRLLRQITGDSTADTIRASMVAEANAMGKAAIDYWSTFDFGDTKGFGGDWPTVAGATAWAATTSYNSSHVRRPTVANGRIYRCIVPGTSGGSEPTWPTTTRGIVQDGTVYWQECTSDITAWAANTAYVVGDIRVPTTRNNRTYVCTVAGTSHASTEPTWPTTTGGTVTDGTVTWKETSGAGSIFYAQYNIAYPYLGASGAAVDLNQTSEIAAALALLYNDPEATDFYTGGGSRTAALALINSHAGKTAACVVSSGGIPVQNTGEVRFDTVYGSFTLHTMAVTVKEMGGLSWNPQVYAFVKNGLDWLDANWQTEPNIGNDVVGGHEAYAAGPPGIPEISWRGAAYHVAGRTNATAKLVYDSSCHPLGAYAQAGQAPSTQVEDPYLFETAAISRGVLTVHTLTPATETDAAQALTHARGFAVTPATETDAAQAITFTQPHTVTLTPATETDTPVALTFSSGAQHVGITPATEGDAAVALSYGCAVPQEVTLTPATESDAAVTLRITRSGSFAMNMQMAPGTVVGAYLRHEWIGSEVPVRGTGSYPGVAVTTATVDDYGEVEFTGLDVGSYIAWAEDYPLRRRFFVMTG